MSKGTLLLADDSITIQKVVNLTFADEGIDVVAVGDGDTAAARLADVKPDIVLADVNMPGLTGYQICEMIRQNETTRDLPVVLLVGSFEPFDEAEATRVGASSYMTKPFQSIRQLVSQVTDLMEGKHTAPEVQIPAVAPSPVDAAPPTAETTDIESLYQSSFDAPNEPDSSFAVETEASRSDFVDVGMDDEMILTTYSSEDPGVGFDNPGETPEQMVLETGSEQFQDDFAEMPTVGEAVDEAIAEPVQSEPIAVRQSASDPFSERVYVEAAGPDEPEPASVEPPAPEPDNFFDMPPAAAAATEATTTAEFDEVDLLEIPGVESGSKLELTTMESAVANESKAQAVSLSPELMDIIVQKVVEKLSEKY